MYSTIHREREMTASVTVYVINCSQTKSTIEVQINNYGIKKNLSNQYGN